MLARYVTSAITYDLGFQDLRALILLYIGGVHLDPAGSAGIMRMKSARRASGGNEVKRKNVRDSRWATIQKGWKNNLGNGSRRLGMFVI